MIVLLKPRMLSSHLKCCVGSFYFISAKDEAALSFQSFSHLMIRIEDVG